MNKVKFTIMAAVLMGVCAGAMAEQCTPYFTQDAVTATPFSANYDYSCGGAVTLSSMGGTALPDNASDSDMYAALKKASNVCLTYDPTGARNLYSYRLYVCCGPSATYAHGNCLTGYQSLQNQVNP